MDFQRLLLVIALSFVLLMLYQAWQKDYGPQPPAQIAASQAPGAAASADDLPSTATRAGAVPEMREGLASARRLHVYTDVYAVEIDTQGGDLRRADLIEYPVSIDKKDEPTRLLDDSGNLLFIAQSGLRPGSGTDAAQVPDHYAVYQAEQDEYRLADGQDQLQVRLQWRDESGVQVDKIYTFHRGSYVVDMDYTVRNQSAQPWAAHAYYQLQRQRPTESKSAFGIYTYTGGVIHGKEVKYEKIDFDAMDKNALSRPLTGGWAAMIQHYFVGAWIPPQDASHDYYSRSLGDNRYLLGMIGDGKAVAPGAEATFKARLYAGPKKQDQLGDVAEGLALTVDYGKLTFIADPIFWLMKQIHKLVGNWGWSIILLTLLIKLAFYKLSATSYRSMANMRKLTPRLTALKERYGDDRQKMNEAMMKMYKEEKINPLGGCLPILVQIPVFIALYWVLLESVELRQAPWILWINDLSAMDPYYVLPVLMGISMLAQHRLNPTPMDPIQAKVMMALPIVFTVFFAFFPAGLVLYWVVNNVLSVTQQWFITRYVVKA